MRKSCLILSCLMFFGACSKVKELDDRTKSMEKSTEKVSTTTDEMKDTTTAMYQQIRSKEAEDTRDEKFDILLPDNDKMGERVTAAGVYFKSMEFQLWNGNDTYDNFHTLMTLYLDAANEFTRRMLDLYDEVNPKKMSPTSDNKYEMSFYAIAAAMHMNHAYQEERVARTKTNTTSMYDLIKKSLLKDHNRMQLLEHEEVLVQGINREIMIELIKARVDMMSALALKNLTDKRDMTLGQKTKALIFKMTKGKFGEIDLPEVYNSSNKATKVYIEKYLDSAVKAKNFLKQIGVNKSLEKTLRSAYKGIDFNENAASDSDKKAVDEKKENIRALIEELLN